MKLVKKLESFGSKEGETSRQITIADCGQVGAASAAGDTTAAAGGLAQVP